MLPKFLLLIGITTLRYQTCFANNEQLISEEIDAYINSLDVKKFRIPSELRDVESLYNSLIAGLHAEIKDCENYIEQIKVIDDLMNSRIDELTERTNKAESRVKEFNKKQIRKLHHKLQQTHSFKEQQRNRKNDRKNDRKKSEERQGQNSDKITEEGDTLEEYEETYEDIAERYVTVLEVEQLFDSILLDTNPWEIELEQYISQVAEDVIFERFVQPLIEQEKYLALYENETEIRSNKSLSCTKPNKLRDIIIQKHRPKEIENLRDYVPSSKIIYDRAFTSPTYTSGIASTIFSMFGETHKKIKDANTNIGSCWPMSMSNGKGKITFVFQDPIVIEAIAIHHVSSLEVTKRQKNKGSEKGTAPRSFHIVGYSVCDDHDDCSFGFETRNSRTLIEGEYLLGDRTVQYFYPHDGVTNSFANINEEKTDDEQNDINDLTKLPTETEGSCFFPPGESYDATPSCGDDNKAPEDEISLVQAVTFVVDENWGHKDYTCLYRLQIFSS